MRTSRIWSINIDELVRVAKEKRAFSDVLRYLGLSTRGSSNHQRLKQRFEEEGIDWREFMFGVGQNPRQKRCLRQGTVSYSLSDILVEGSTYQNRRVLKKRLVSEGLLEDKCYSCGLVKWLGRKISLQLDHKNGIFNDNRLTNLWLLCPNCHSLTDTYGGKNKRSSKKKVA